MNELIVRSTDVIKIQAAAFNASELRQARESPARGVFATVPIALPDAVGPLDAGVGSRGSTLERGAAAKFKPPKVPKVPPTAELSAYLAILAG